MRRSVRLGAAVAAGLLAAVLCVGDLGVERSAAWATRPMKSSQGPARRGKQTLVKILQDPGSYEGKAKWAIKNMQKYKMFGSSWEYVLAMKKLTQVGDPQSALTLWKDMRAEGIEPNGAAYSAAIVALDCDRKTTKVVSMLEEMKVHNVFPIRIGCEHALMSCERGAQWETAVWLLDEMWERGITPNEDSYMPAIRACEMGGQFDKADELFKQMRANTKMQKFADASGMADANLKKKPPLAKKAPWRLPGAVALDAFDAPRLPEAPREQ